MSVYTDLITNYHRAKPLFVEHIDLSTRPFEELSLSLERLVAAFDIDVATGKQLDVLGEWIGRTRKINAPIEDYFFTLDSESLGLDLGTWKDRYEPVSGLISVDDDDFRTMLRAKIGANNWDGTAESLPSILKGIYTRGNVKLSFTDNQDMTITVNVMADNMPSITKEIINQGYLAIKPAGIAVIYKINGE
ncbi:DUF2612 domain-containing protein [Erwinia sp. HDF1-3R]|uniref:DUF2612 domain-containing protein n=1 Tax=Erwinia sp. HDF1-3R TaxID=3141543 RepID=UPI0031F55799